MTHFPEIAVLGAGAFGTALAAVIAGTGRSVSLFGRDKALIETIQDGRIHTRALPDKRLPDSLIATADPNCLVVARTLLLAVPSQQIRRAIKTHSHLIPSDTELVICAKGIEQSTGLFLDETVMQERQDCPISILSGPGFAADIVRGLPTAMTLASSNQDRADNVARQLSGGNFRLYASTDVKGVAIGGALKNVLAIASGIVEGKGLGDSARAALIARGLAEMGRFCRAHGGRAETISGLSGLGDLVLTATSHQSRNLRFGIELGRGTDLSDLMAPGAPLSEGAFTATVAANISRQQDIDMPITQCIAQIIDGDLTVDEAIDVLMSRPLTRE